MISLSGYTINKQIYESNNSIIYRGVYDKEGTPVVIKLLKGEFPSPEQLARFRREYEMTRKYTGKRIIKAHKLEKYRNTLAIILEDYSGESLAINLSDNKQGIKTYLSIAIQMTEALEQVHLHHVIHKDVNPSNFVWNPETDQLKIIDFGISTELSRETTEIDSPDVLEGTLAYISPEQTGRMNKSIDYRTDFYSLGITFYQILTGSLPFYSDDAMEMVYSHIARVPVFPDKLNPDVPSSVSEIVMKLLSKSAEDRYQSTLGLKKDLLYCLNQIELNGTVAKFKIAQHDIFDRFQIPQKLYGREKEINQLITSFERVAVKGINEILLVTGQSGIGKSSLINEVQKAIVENRGYFLSGKFEQLKRDIPYSSLIQAVKGLIRQLLSEQEERVASIREKILNALGSNGQIIIDIIPEVELIIGKQQGVPELPPEQSRLRFEYTFQSFIGSLSAREHPLVLFLDDLQWADASSLQLINVIISETDIRYLLIIGAFRDNEVLKGHPLLITLAEIEKKIKINMLRLSPLDISHANQLILETLSVKPEESIHFAELCFNKTQGNPFFLNQFLHMLHRSDAISFNRGKRCWQWDVAKIQQMEITDNVIDLMIAKIRELPQNTQHLLSLAACIGTQFDLKILSVVYDKSLKDTANDLWKGLQEDLVEPVDKSYKYVGLGNSKNESGTLFMIPTYRFIHDRIQQAAYQIIEDNQKLATHWKIGEMMLENLSGSERDEKLFDIVEHLNLGNKLATTRKEKDQLVELNLKAGLKARDSAAYGSSFYYFQEGIRLLGEKTWEKNELRTRGIYTQATEAAYLSGDFKQTEFLSQIVLQNTNQLLDQVKIYEIRILSNIAQNLLNEANRVGIQTLKMLGIQMFDNPGKKELFIAYLKVRWHLRGKNIEHLDGLPEMTDSHKLASVRILSSIHTSSFFTNPLVGALTVFKQMVLCLKYGITASSPPMYAAYALIICGFRKLDTGYRFGQLALRLAEQPQFKQYKSRTIYMVHVFVNHWKNHIKETPPRLQIAYKIGIENGDPEYASYAISWYCFYLPLLGKDLKSLLKNDFAHYLSAVKKLKVDTSTYCLEIISQFVYSLTEKTTDPCCLMGEYYNENNMLPIHKQANDGFVIHLLFLFKLILSYLLEDFNLALKSGNQCKKYMRTTASPTVPLVYFYHSLTRLALYPQAKKTQKKHVLKKVVRNQKLMKQWSDHAPMNYLHKYHLVEAELASVLNKTGKAVVHYEQAIKGAKENEFIQEEALANELFAKFWLKRGNSDSSQLYMKKAHNLYQRWGATIKVYDLEKRYSHLLNIQPRHTSESTSITTSKILDIDSVLKATQAISGEIVLDSLLKKMMTIIIQNAGARKALLILKEDDSFIIAGNASSSKSEDIIYESKPIEKSEELSQAIVNYTIRTHKTVVLSDAANQGEFIQDAYVRKNLPKSILCAPIIRQNELIGILYLENDQTTDVFTPERIKVIQILISQAAISLEKANLYNNLSQSEEKYRDILKSINEGYCESDLAGNYTFANESFTKMFGYSKKEVLCMNYKKIMSEKTAKKLYLVFNTVYKTGKPVKGGYEFEVIRKDGSKFICDLSLSLIKDSEGKQTGFRGIVSDISDRKKKEIAEMKREAAEEASKTKSDFLANMSHEIRTPLNGILGMAGLLLDTSLDEEQNDYAQTIHYSGDALLTILNDILDFSKIEAGKLEFEVLNFDLRGAIEEMVDLLAIKAHEKGLAFGMFIHHDVPSYLRGDPGRLRQIITNLIGNAVKFTQTGEVVLKIVTASETDSHVTLKVSVTDTGKGIPKDRMNRLFESFSQVDSSDSRKFGGTGLGLAIAKRLTELMGGQIGVESEISKGSTFWFSVTLEKQPVDQVIESVIPADIYNKRILAVDGNETTRDILDSHLHAIGCRYKVVSNFQDAIVQIIQARNEQDLFHLVIIDHMMPDFDDQIISKTISSDPELKETRLVMLTTFGMRGDAARARDMGFAAYLTKPIKTSQLHECLFRLLSKFHQPDESTSKPEIITRYTLSEGKKRKVRILLADDNIVNQKLGLRLLQKAGYHADAVANGKEVIEVLEQMDYDIILMDINMPEMDGLEATEKIRNARSTRIRKDIPIIAMTAQAMSGDKEECLQAGMNDYISKPIQPQIMFQVIEKYIDSATEDL